MRRFFYEAPAEIMRNYTTNKVAKTCEKVPNCGKTCETVPNCGKTLYCVPKKNVFGFLFKLKKNLFFLLLLKMLSAGPKSDYVSEVRRKKELLI